MEISKVKTGSALLLFAFTVYAGFQSAVPQCFKHKDCRTCTLHHSWMGWSCRWCPLDRVCHAAMSPRNPCLRRQNVRNPWQCTRRTSKEYNPYDAYKLALFSAIAYSDEPDQCLNALFPDDDFITKRVVSFDCDGILFEYKDCLAFIAVSQDRKEIVVAYRGTRGYQQILHEVLSLIAVPKVRSAVGGKTQHYFEHVHQRLYHSVRNVLRDLMWRHPDYSVKLTGHSLGGAVASITSAALVKDRVLPSENLFLYTFGMPRVGNKIYAEFHDRLVKNSWRVVRAGDRITQLPPCIPPCSIFNGPYHHGKKVLYEQEHMTVSSNFTICLGSDESNSKCKHRRVKRGFTGNLVETHKYYFGIPIGTYCRDFILKNITTVMNPQ